MSSRRNRDGDAPLPEAPPGTADDPIGVDRRAFMMRGAAVGAPAAEPRGAARRASTDEETSEDGLAVSVVLR